MDFVRKIFALLIVAIFAATALQVYAAQSIQAELGDEDNAAEELGKSAEKFFATLPKAKGNYKSRQRPILIEGAMNSEVGVLARALENPVTYRHAHYLYVAGTYKDYPVVVLRTEQGMTNAAASTALAINFFNPVAVINQGTAGGHLVSMKNHDIVIGALSVNLSAYVTDHNPADGVIDITKQEMRGTYAYDKDTGKFQPNAGYFSDEKLVEISGQTGLSNKNFNVVTGIIGSEDAWIKDVDHINFLFNKYGAICEDMETCSVAQICHSADIPFVGVRVISDNVTNGETYDAYTAVTCQNFVLLVVENYIRDVLKK